MLTKKKTNKLFSASFLKIKVLFIVAHDEHITLLFSPPSGDSPLFLLSVPYVVYYYMSGCNTHHLPNVTIFKKKTKHTKQTVIIGVPP